MGEKRELQIAMGKISDEVLDGLRHGFFKMTLVGEIVHGRKRRLMIQAGKSHQYTISEEELVGK